MIDPDVTLSTRDEASSHLLDPTGTALRPTRRRHTTVPPAERWLAFEVPAEEVGALEKTAAASGATLHAALHAVYVAQLARWSGRSEFTVRTPDGPVTARVSRTESFRSLLRETRSSLETTPARPPVAGQTEGPEPAEVVLARGGTPFGATEHDLALTYVPRDDGSLGFRVRYAEAAFEKSTMRGLARRYRLLLRHVCELPDAMLEELPLQEERDGAHLADLGVGAPLRTRPATVLERFAATVRERPRAVAVVDRGTALSYAELNLRAEFLARRLVSAGAGPESVVAVCLPRSADLVVAILGVLRAGAAYLPLDPAYPVDRLAYMVGDSDAGILVTGQGVLPDGVRGEDVEVVHLHGDEGAQDLAAPTSPCGPVDPGQCAYVIYTSGSTGRPKGVQVSHASLAALLAGLEESGTIRAGTGRVGWNASPSFDASVQQWIRVVRGDTLVLFDDAVRLDPKRLATAVAEERLTDFDITPSHLEYVLPRLGPLLGTGSGLRLWVGGEPLSPTLQRHLGGLADRLDAVNVYGTTETTVDTTVVVVRGDEPTHLGAPLPGQTVRVLDDRLRPVPAGRTGDLYVCGSGVARGYLGRPGLTAAVFLPDPWAGDGSRMYRTGDRARWTADGRLEFHGRADRQVKIRGYRVELGEIEAVLAEHPQVLECAVLRRLRGDGSLLDAYLRMTEAGSVEQVRERAERLLPHWMRPATYTLLSVFPRTVGGKLDRPALADRGPRPASRTAA
ncbi:amino acid adenylation domain-containing protein [Streptomyces phaeolivaceus]|uniref:Amino acid adenylation domain-containing protein n=1 Tax=Streptomyces phaeolivaceus TaxID=2653200 RepID=A0A5P8KD39_9ACTN|nr:amino acid adenylation domain-containing protein [Streptomyces phaeolivaceus]QFR00450.1 amino acid adenylation domain-containing protein [Streptomyces phaeolivaceus]